ncbi:MAG: hypothetical protein KUG82_16825 [Pseudomonadales bacterium]|nr:hypothetical protein [Pseudomonadales bacterium]
MTHIKKVVIPISAKPISYLGGTTFNRLELLPLFDKVLIQHIAEEIQKNNFEEVFLITTEVEYPSPGAHWEAGVQLSCDLQYEIKDSLSKVLGANVKIKWIYQRPILNLANALLGAETYLSCDPSFAIIFPHLIRKSHSASISEMHHSMLGFSKHVVGTIQSSSSIYSMKAPSISQNKTQFQKQSINAYFEIVPDLSGRIILQKSIFLQLRKIPTNLNSAKEILTFIGDKYGVSLYSDPIEYYNCKSVKGYMGCVGYCAGESEKNHHYKVGVKELTYLHQPTYLRKPTIKTPSTLHQKCERARSLKR